MVIGKMSRENLRNHRRSVYMALSAYALQANEKIGIGNEMVPMRIMESVKGTRIKLPKTIVPERFINLVLAANDTKKYRIEFHQSHKDYIHIVLKGKPLIDEGLGILMFFFRELLQHLEKIPNEFRNAPRLVATSRTVAAKK